MVLEIDGLKPRIGPVELLALLKRIEKIFLCDPIDPINAPGKLDFEIVQDVLPLPEKPCDFFVRPIAIFLRLFQILDAISKAVLVQIKLAEVPLCGKVIQMLCWCFY